MDYELKERLHIVGRLITDISPGSIRDLERKAKALSILRDIVAPEPEMIPAVKDGINSLERITGVKMGQEVVAVLEFVYSEGAYNGHPSQPENPEKACVADAAAYSILGAKAANDRRSHVDDIEFFRNGGI